MGTQGYKEVCALEKRERDVTVICKQVMYTKQYVYVFFESHWEEENVKP